MMKRIFCILLSLIMLLSASLVLAEDTAADTAENTAETISAEPVLLVTVNGKEIWSNDEYLSMVLSSYLDYAESYGYDTSDQEMLDTINWYSLLYTIRTQLIRQKAAELGLDQITDEEKADMETTAKAQWAEILDSYAVSSGLMTDDSTDDEKAAARADMAAQFLEIGYDEARYVSEYMESVSETLLTERIEDYLTADMAVTDEEVQAYFDDLVKEDQEAYENDIGTYEFYTQYYGQSSYYTPEGYRGITHILLNVDDELMNTWKDLSARLEEQLSDETAEATEEASAGSETEEVPAESEEEAAPTAEPVTEEMVKAAEQAILDSVQSTVDEIMTKLESGVSFDDLIKEYGNDPGMQNDDTRASGYAVHKDSILWDPAFTSAAMALEKIGDVGQPVVGQYGVHILHYLRDIPGGAVELTDEMKEEFRATLSEEMKAEALSSALDQWMNESDIVYTEDGEQWKLPEKEEAQEVAEEAAAEETGEAEE